MIGLTKLCPPAEFYLVISMIALVMMSFQNIGNKDMYCLGEYSCVVPNTISIFFIKLVYILFWTWLLNIICKGGASWLSWVIALFPLILFFTLLSLLFVSKTLV